VHLGAHCVRVTFSDGLVRELDLAGLVLDGVWARLAEPEAFARVAVDPVAGTLAWGDLDLDPDVLHGDEVPATGPAPVLVRQYRLRPTG